MHNSDKWFITIIIIGIILQATAVIITPLYDDSAAMAQFGYLAMKNKVAWLLYPHPPIGFIFYFIPMLLLGVSDLSIKLPPLLFNFATIYLIYELTKRIYNLKNVYYKD